MGIYLFAILLILMGGASLIYFFKSVFDNIVYLFSAVRAEAQVIRLNTSYNKRVSRGSGLRTMYKPVFEYRSHKGSHTYTSSIASNPPAYQVGETTTILFLAKNPYRAKINSFSEMWLFPLIFGFLGFSLVAFAFVLFT